MRFVAILLLNLTAWLFGRLDRRSAVVGLLLIYAAVIVVDTQADELTAADVGFPWFLFTLFWGASVFVTSREGHAREAEERAQQMAIEQETASLQAVAEERQRIARELHDVIAHSVSVMTVQAGAVRRLLLPEQERERQALEIVESTGREALTEMRRLVGLLREHGHDARVRAAALTADARHPDRNRPRGRPRGRPRHPGRGAGAAAGRRPLRLPARPGGARRTRSSTPARRRPG